MVLVALQKLVKWTVNVYEPGCVAWNCARSLLGSPDVSGMNVPTPATVTVHEGELPAAGAIATSVAGANGELDVMVSVLGQKPRSTGACMSPPPAPRSGAPAEEYSSAAQPA